MFGWVGSVITNKKRLQTKGAAEMLVKCHLGVLGELAAKFGFKLSMVFELSERNKTDILTRVKRA